MTCRISIPRFNGQGHGLDGRPQGSSQPLKSTLKFFPIFLALGDVSEYHHICRFSPVVDFFSVDLIGHFLPIFGEYLNLVWRNFHSHHPFGQILYRNCFALGRQDFYLHKTLSNQLFLLESGDLLHSIRDL
ncbi:hypothetical protein ES703_88904 [subsurface metagenome]